MSNVDKLLEESKKLREASTAVVAWYPYGTGDGYHPDNASVRGPFGRWFIVQGGDNGMGDSIKFPTPVASLDDDAKFAAHAMNNAEKYERIIASAISALRVISMTSKSITDKKYDTMDAFIAEDHLREIEEIAGSK